MKIQKNLEGKIIFWGILGMFLLGGLFHSLYDILGKPFALALFFPVNESIFEHIKIAVLPVFIWWSVWYLIKKDSLNANKWFTSALISMVVSGLLVPVLYYFYTGTFGIESMIIDISILLIAFAISQSIAYHYYKYGKGIDYKISISIMIIIITLVALATLYPPEFPVFREESSGTYGITVE